MSRRLEIIIFIVVLLVLGLGYCAVSFNDIGSEVSRGIPANETEAETTSDFNATDVNATDMNPASNAASIEANGTSSAGSNAAGNVAATTSTTAAPGPEQANEAIGTTDVEPGRGAFVQPGAMDVGNWYPLEFVAARDEAALANQSEGLPLTASHPIYVSRMMRVTLLPDANFDVRPKSDALQDAGTDKSASWSWDIRPLNKGTHVLMAKVEVLTRQKGGVLEPFNQYTRRVAVEVRVGGWQGLLDGVRNATTLGDALKAMFKSWQGALIALAALIGAFFSVRAAIRKGRKRPNGTKTPDERKKD